MFLRLLLPIALAIKLLGCHEDPNSESLEESVPPECQLDVLLEWDDHVLGEDKEEAYWSLGDELVERTLSAEQFKVAIEFDVMNNNKFRLYFNQNCERKDRYVAQLFSSLLSSREGLLSFSMKTVGSEERR